MTGLRHDLEVSGSGLFGLTAGSGPPRSSACPGWCSSGVTIRGDAWSERTTGIEVSNKYGVDLLHTSNERVWEYVNRFTSFTGYLHRVFTVFKGRVCPMPINLATTCECFGKHLTPTQARELVARQAGEVRPQDAANLEDKAVSMIRRSLYEAFLRGYTRRSGEPTRGSGCCRSPTSRAPRS